MWCCSGKWPCNGLLCCGIPLSLLVRCPKLNLDPLFFLLQFAIYLMQFPITPQPPITAQRQAPMQHIELSGLQAFCPVRSIQRLVVRAFEITCFPTVCRAECCLYAAQTRCRTTVPGRGRSRDSRQSRRLQPSCLPAHPPPGRSDTFSEHKQSARGSYSEF